MYNKNQISQPQQIGRLFRKGSFFDKAFRVVASFVPFGSVVTTITDNIGSDEGWFHRRSHTEDRGELNGIIHKPKVF